MATYSLRKEEFVIEDYAGTRPFASFLPGIAGLWGIPMWTFYVNRGQAIAGFGIQDKDHPIMEFQAANRAYRTVQREGFRTFIKRLSAPGKPVYEPFSSPVLRNKRAAKSQRITQRMRVRMQDLVIEESDPQAGLDLQAHYFTVPHESFAGLCRVLTVTNSRRKPQTLQVVDGLPVIIPHGMLDRFLKNMSRTIEAWVTVENLDRKAPFFHLKVEPHARPEVVPIRAGNCAAFILEADGKTATLPPIIDPSIVFGNANDFAAPERLLDGALRIPARQLVADKTPCAMTAATLTLKPGQSARICSLYGHADSIEQFNQNLPKIQSPGFFLRKAHENKVLIDDLTAPITTRSGLEPFDQYCRQTYLDNAMRGGVPVRLGGKNVYVYSRKHGDLERDYNYFVVPATHFSQGNANYRDVNQNRRNDVWFYPEIGEQNLVTFFNLIQADGYNPLVFKGTRYVSESKKSSSPLHDLVTKPFTPGELLRQIERRRIKLPDGPHLELEKIMSGCREIEDADHGEGFWTDHWTYNLDLIERYLALFPDRLRSLLERRSFTFYDNSHVVVPRAKKYRLAHGKVRQYHSVEQDHEKNVLIQSRAEDAHKVRADHGKGPVYTTTLLGKILCLLVNRLSSLDPSGIGVEMEAEKPNWYDALNGLPGLLGSSACETFEMKRWLRFTAIVVDKLRPNDAAAVTLPVELADFMEAVRGQLDAPALVYWQKATDAREAYRASVRLGFSGEDRPVALSAVQDFLRAALKKVERGLEAAVDSKTRLPYSYFLHEVQEHRVEEGADGQVIVPLSFQRHALPLFLEGIVHALRTAEKPEQARALHRAVKASPLYDRQLKMYKVCAPLSGESEEIGRCRVFTPGWLENESVWLHMAYKYLLELLRCGLVDEFHAELPASLIAFQPPKRYGRSVLENSSFIVSSAYPDKSLHGAGFVARLSGATAEFLHMWLGMTAGLEPFSMNEQGRLELRLAPALTPAFFDKKGTFEFRFLGRTTVRYLNPGRRPTFGPGGVRPNRIRLTPANGQAIEWESGVIPAPYAEDVRAGRVALIEVDLAKRAPEGDARGAQQHRPERARV